MDNLRTFSGAVRLTREVYLFSYTFMLWYYQCDSKTKCSRTKHRRNQVNSLELKKDSFKSTIVDHEDYIVVYRKYGSVMFIAGITQDENELAVLEIFQLIVETLMKHFDKLTEVHIMYNLDKVYIILDEIIMNGLVVETNQPRILAPLQLFLSSKS